MDELLARIAELERARQAEKRRARRWLAAGLCVLILGLVALAPKPSQSAASNSQQGGLPALDQRVTQLESLVAALQQSNSDQAGQIAALKLRADQDESALAALTLRVGQAESALAAHAARVAAVEAKTAPISVVGTAFIITGKNVFIQDGSGATASTTGLGNLTVGYNGLRGSVEDRRTGSHNLILGDMNNYTTFGGFVAGTINEIGNEYASVSGGAFNTASGNVSSITGGVSNQATGIGAHVSGGNDNTAGGLYATVTGGIHNKALGDYSSVSGGVQREVDGRFNWAAGALFQAN